MKKLTYLFLATTLLLSVGLVSCDDDDSSTDIVGKWSLVREVGYYKDFEEPRWDEEWDNTYDIGKEIIEFQKNGTFTMKSEGDKDTYYAKWKQNDDNITITWPADEDNDEHIEKAQISSLTATELIVEFHNKNKYEETYSRAYYQRID